MKTVSDMQIKICGICDNKKHILPCGRIVCLHCAKRRRKNYHDRNKKDIKKRRKEKRKTDHDRIIGYQRRYQRGNRDLIQSRERARNESNFRNWISLKLSQTKSSSRKRKLICSITLEELLNKLKAQSKKCAITRVDLSHSYNNLYSLSIDRIDSNKYYVCDNVQLVCKAINFGKNNHSNKEIIELINELRNPIEHELDIRPVRSLWEFSSRSDYYKDLRQRDPRRFIRSSLATKKSNLTLDYVMQLFDDQKGKCALSGLTMVNVNSLKSISIDRIDSTIGYVINNIQLVCKWINLAKNTHTNPEMRKFLREIKQIQLSNG